LRPLEVSQRPNKRLRAIARGPLRGGIRISVRRKTLIISAALSGVHENIEDLMQTFHLARGRGPQLFVRLAIGMQKAGQRFVGLANLLNRSIVADAEFLVKIHHGAVRASGARLPYTL